MLRIGIVGLGDVANKAYLPVISGRKIDVHLYTRNKEKLSHVGAHYRFTNLHQSLDSLIASGIKAAFVHTPTTSHHEIVEQLLLNGIHVYIDKPITYHYESSKALSDLAERKNLILMTGFNRRYAPAYQRLKTLHEPNMILMQKNRSSLPGDVRIFVFDDFIHVVDTLRYLFPYPIDELIVNGRKKDNLLYHVVVQFKANNGATAIGVMNRDSGTVTEKVEVITSQSTSIVCNLMDTVIYRDKNETRQGTSDWESTLHKRGFEQIITDFLTAVELNTPPMITKTDALLTHQLCEEIVERLI